MLEYRLKDFKWAGMLSIWGQKEKWWQGVCYSGLNWHPQDYIKEIGEHAPPVSVWLIRYVDMACAMRYFEYCINHLIPEEVLKYCTFTRISGKTMHLWPKRFENRLLGKNIINPEDYQDGWGDYDDEYIARAVADAGRGPLLGCYPWLRVDFDQRLSANTMFAVSVLLRYASEHGPTLKALEALTQMGLKKRSPEQLFSIANLLGQARGHAIGNFSYVTKSGVPRFLAGSTWRQNFLKMEAKMAPFHSQPMKDGEIDPYFNYPMPRYNARDMEMAPHNAALEKEVVRNGVGIIANFEQMDEFFKMIEGVKA